MYFLPGELIFGVVYELLQIVTSGKQNRRRDVQGSRDQLGVQTAFCTRPKNNCKPMWEVAFLLGLNELSQKKRKKAVLELFAALCPIPGVFSLLSAAARGEVLVVNR